jgi:hypothetical protein
MEKREKQIFDSDAFRSAIYVDPRINFKGSNFLSALDKEKAVVRI